MELLTGLFEDLGSARCLTAMLRLGCGTVSLGKYFRSFRRIVVPYSVSGKPRMKLTY